MTERALLLATAGLVVFVRTALWMLPSWASLAVLQRLARREPRPWRGGRPAVERLTAAVVAASRYVPRATCLTQAVAAQLLLIYFGYRATLEVGVARAAGGDFVAHAWLERDGCIVIGGSTARAFTRLNGFGHASTRGRLDG